MVVVAVQNSGRSLFADSAADGVGSSRFVVTNIELARFVQPFKPRRASWQNQYRVDPTSKNRDRVEQREKRKGN
jgi:hypothetical protein